MTPEGASIQVSKAAGGALLASGRRRVFAVWCVVALTLVLYWPTVASLLPQWGDFGNLTYAHGYLIVAIGAWMLWRRRHTLGAQPFSPSWLGCAAVVLASVAWLVVFRAGIQLAHQLLLPIIAWLAVLSVCGRRVASQCLVPLAYVYFAIPVWDQINGILQAATVVAARVTLQAVGIPAYFEGNFVHIPEGTFEIAGGCSGLHFFIVALAIAGLYGELHRDTFRMRMALLFTAGATAIVGNGIRVFSIILAGHLTDMQHYLVRVDHYYFGWGVFAVVMMLFFLLARRLPLAQEEGVASAISVHSDARESRGNGWIAIATLVALVIAPVWDAVSTAGDATSRLAVEVEPIAGWSGPLPQQGLWRPRFENPDKEISGVVRAGSTELDLYVAAYAAQRQDKELIAYGNSIAGPGYSAGAGTVRNLSGGRPVNEIALTDGDGGESLVWYAYRVDRRMFASGTMTQLWYGIASLAGAHHSVLIAARAPCAPTCVAASEGLARFASDSGLFAGRGLRIAGPIGGS